MAERDQQPSLPQRLRGHAWWLTAAVLVLLGLGLAWHTTGDLDAPLHDRLGRALLSGEGVPARNHFSFTAPEHPWTNHEWGFQLAIALSGKLAGGEDLAGRAAGWQWLRLLLASLLVALLVSRFRGAAAALLGPVALVTLAMLWTRLTLRPELLSYLLFVLVLLRVEASLRREPRASWWRQLIDPRRPGGQALLLSLLWYQCHGFAVLAPLVWLLGGALARSPLPWTARWRLAAGGAVLSLLAGLLTPAGVDGLLVPLRTLGQFGGEVDLRRTISELVPLLETRGSLALTLDVFRASLVWGLLWIVARWGRVSPLRTVLWLLAAAAAWQGQRNLGFYAIAFLLLHDDLGPATATPWQRLRARLPGPVVRHGGRVLPLALPAATWLVAIAWLLALASDTFYLREGVARRWGPGLTPANYVAVQARRLAADGPLRTANTVDAASSLIAAGAGPVAIDGRTEAYPARVWRDYADFRQGGNGTIGQLRDWRAEAVCLAHRNTAAHPILQTLLAHPGWALIDADPGGVLLRPRRPADLGNAEVLGRGSAQLERELAAAPPGRDVRLADRLAAWANLLLLAGQDPAAEDFLLAARERCADHPVVLHNLGNLLLARGELRGSLRLFEEAARLNRNAAPPLVNAGNCLFQLGRPEEAERSLERAIRRDPRNFEAWANLAEVRRRQDDRRGAAEAYERALELRPGDSRLRQRARSLGAP